VGVSAQLLGIWDNWVILLKSLVQKTRLVSALMEILLMAKSF